MLGHEEVYVVVRGRARFRVGEDEFDAPAGTIVHLRDPATRRHAVAAEDGTAVLAVGGKPGAPFEPSAWEWYFEAEKYRPAQDWAAASELLREGLDARPDDPSMLYHVACYEALAGDADGAVPHLRRAIELDERFRGYAREDEDFAAIRDRPDFAELIAGA